MFLYAEYLSSVMVAPELINALYHFPAWTVIVGQSLMHATVIVSSMGVVLPIHGVHYQERAPLV